LETPYSILIKWGDKEEMFYGTAVAVDDHNYYTAVLYEDLTGCIGTECADKKVAPVLKPANTTIVDPVVLNEKNSTAPVLKPASTPVEDPVVLNHTDLKDLGEPVLEPASTPVEDPVLNNDPV